MVSWWAGFCSHRALSILVRAVLLAGDWIPWLPARQRECRESERDGVEVLEDIGSMCKTSKEGILKKIGGKKVSDRKSTAVAKFQKI